jgi:hypothetical protein
MISTTRGKLFRSLATVALLTPVQRLPASEVGRSKRSGIGSEERFLADIWPFRDPWEVGTASAIARELLSARGVRDVPVCNAEGWS